MLGHQQNQKLIPLPQWQIEDSWHNPKRVVLPPITDRGCNTKIKRKIYALKEKPQISKVSPELIRSGKSDGQRSRIWMGIAPNNRLITSHWKRESRPAWGNRTILNRLESITLYQNTRNPRQIFPRNFRTIREKPSTERHPPAMFLRVLHPKDTPHKLSHAH